MTPLSDLAQIILNLPQPGRWFALLMLLSVLLLLLRTALKGIGLGWRAVKSVGGWFWAKSLLNVWGGGWFWRMVRLCALTFVFSSFAPQIHDGLQRIEQTYHTPAYVIQHSEPEVAFAYEKQIEQHLTQSEASFFRRRIDEIAAKIGSTPLALMEVGYSECALNPFAFNTEWNKERQRWDTLAAGFIQFTPTGLLPCYLDGQKVSFRQVKDWCKTRNLERVMTLTEVYFDAFAKGRPLPRAIDIYLCVFAPKYIGQPFEATMYDRWNTPKEYWGGGNEYFDGYFLKTHNGKPLIMRLNSAMDGRITVGELALHLEKKKALLVGGAKK